MINFVKLISTLLLFVFLIISFLIFSNGSLQEEKTLLLNRTSTSNIAKKLKKEEAISNPYIFWITVQAMKVFGPIKAGEYRLEPHISNFEIIRRMQKEDVIVRKISIPEGYTTVQIIELIQKQDKLIGNINISYKDGELLPETYLYTYGETKEDLLNRMFVARQEILDNLWKKRDKDLKLKTKQDALILASVVEKEAKIDEDRPKIASVFINRLNKGMKLEADPTTIYAITKGKYVLDRPLSLRDLRIKSPFNTYVHKGLPPSPIANPGISSIKAVLQPIDTKYIFFVVADCEGSHNFTNNLRQHRKNIKLYRSLKCS